MICYCSQTKFGILKIYARGTIFLDLMAVVKVCDLDMHFNPRKFQVMNISSAPPPPPRMFYQDLEAVEHAKYLGLEIGKFLSWILHIHNVTVKADRTLGYIQVRKIYMY